MCGYQGNVVAEETVLGMRDYWLEMRLYSVYQLSHCIWVCECGMKLGDMPLWSAWRDCELSNDVLNMVFNVNHILNKSHSTKDCNPWFGVKISKKYCVCKVAHACPFLYFVRYQFMPLWMGSEMKHWPFFSQNLEQKKSFPCPDAFGGNPQQGMISSDQVPGLLYIYVHMCTLHTHTHALTHAHAHVHTHTHTHTHKICIYTQCTPTLMYT